MEKMRFSFAKNSLAVDAQAFINTVDVGGTVTWNQAGVNQL
jgi:hypothetical protein